jgi:superfamily II DNA or RNA helicase
MQIIPQSKPVYWGDRAEMRRMLMETYDRLDDDSRTLLDLLALYGTTSADNLERLCRVAKVGNPDRIRKNLATLKLIDDSHWSVGCNLLIRELCVQRAAYRGELDHCLIMVRTVDPLFARKPSYPGDSGSGSRYQFHGYTAWIVPALRVSLYLGDTTGFASIVRECGTTEHVSAIAGEVVNNPFEPSLLRGMPHAIRDEILAYVCYHTVKWVEDLGPLDAVVSHLLKSNGASSRLREVGAILSLFRGDAVRCIELFPNEKEMPPGLQTMLFAMTGRYDEALKAFEPVVKQMRKDRAMRRSALDHPGFQFYLLCMLRENTSASRAATLRVLGLAGGHERLVFESVFGHLRDGITELDRADARTGYLSPLSQSHYHHPWTVLFAGLVHVWTGGGGGPAEEAPLRAGLERAEKAGLPWFAAQIAAVLHRLGADSTSTTTVHGSSAETVCPPLCNMLHVKAPWQLTLEKIDALAPPPPKAKTDAEASTARLIWLLREGSSYDYRGRFGVIPALQKPTKRGTWSRPCPLTKKNLDEAIAVADERDKPRLEHLASGMRQGYSSYQYFEIDDGPGILSFSGHPHLYSHNDHSVHMELVRDEIRIRVNQSKGGYRVTLEPPIDQFHNQEFLTVNDTNTRIRILPISARQRRLNEILGKDGIVIPSEGKEILAKTLSAIGAIAPIESTVAGISEQQAVAVETDERIWVVLSPTPGGLAFVFAVRPIPDGRTYPPGHGGKTVFETINGARHMAERALSREVERARDVGLRCLSLLEWTTEDEWRYDVDDPTDCLAALSELRSIGEGVEMLWPQGEKYRVTSPIDAKSMHLRIGKKNDWFDLSGELQIDEGRTIAMRTLLELLDGSTQRFVKLEDGQFLALTAELRRRLDDIRAFTQVQGSSLRLHPLAAAAIGELDEENDSVVFDEHWRAVVGKMRSMDQFAEPVPTTFAGELRDYQRDGFLWMARLAHIGAGACLADDMGLGKTVQTLALLLARASGGPALIVAPLSVCGNWIAEAQRFAPSLRVHQFGMGDRTQLIEKAGPQDLITCSYGLLQQESELFAGKQWHTVVLDEAQAIKNNTAKRSQAAMDLKADMRLVTTGTPIENRLSEIWSIFRFINPGLLGSLDTFNRRFAAPIEARRDPDARHRLKRIISPFILRRTKAEVLSELPPKTTIVVNVDMSAEETAFYEAVRRKAVDVLEEVASDPSHNHLRILAEITRMRRACCHSSLVMPDMTISSSKLAVFGERVEELIANNHRALVFSQFVDYLSIVRSFLDEKGIEYQYLDGSTPQRDRQRAVADFQAGTGALFLISLRAGGFGLNLTGADYVLHMDPWWNPAVEDQASDRVHRIGQTRPVTIYRFVTVGTIEEKILTLHAEKRDLAESLLDGGEMSGKVSAEELLRLIREE